MTLYCFNHIWVHFLHVEYQETAFCYHLRYSDINSGYEESSSCQPLSTQFVML